jgi:phage tail-like protein
VQPPRCPSTDGCRGLYRLSLPAFARSGEAASALTCDSGRAAAIWHRLYLEAEIPDHCGVTVWLATTNNPTDKPVEWFPHQFGSIFAPDASTPRGAWVRTPSEVPWQPPMLKCPADKNRSGLFTALIQRPGKRVRSLRGRYLRVRVEFEGTGLHTPEIAALRAYSSRFSYADHYLPELYREDVFGPEGDQQGAATPADFLERMIDNFEGVLTPIEDRISDSYLLTRPGTTPPEALEWLANWIGITFDSAYGDTQRRELLSSAPELYRCRGTLKGLGLALDIATGGAVRSGQIVILEDYRLRRTFATILGADLSDADDPLLAGISRSGNSFVGDTLVLGDPYRKEFLALFAATLPQSRAEARAIAAFFDRLAYRVTILLHQEINPQDLRLVRRVAALETPAHVAVRVEAATNEFRAGIASLVGVDSYLAPKPAPGTATVEVSYIGRGDLIERAPALDPRLGGEDVVVQPPVARLDAPAFVTFGGSFTLNASESKAFEGRKIVSYIWTMLD